MCDLLTDPFVEHLRSERQQRIPTDQELVPMTREPHAIEMRLETRTPMLEPWARRGDRFRIIRVMNNDERW